MAESTGAHTVTIYTTPSCGFCKMAKAFFQEHSIKYTELNVLEDLKARSHMMEASGQSGVPVIEIDSEIVVGFNKPKLSELLLGK